jgi:phosphocarrier protein HPr
MIQIDHIINNVDGLHARPIAELADIAKKLGTQTFILKGEKITNVISFGARYGQKITIVINGYNEDNASELVKEYIKNNL